MNSRRWKIRIGCWSLLTLALACTTDSTRRGYLERNAAAFDAPPRRPAIIIPGFGVTRLYDPVTGRYVWGTPRTAMHTRYDDDLDLPAEGRDRLIPRGYVGSRGPVNVGWQLTEALRKYGGYTRDVTVHPFHYDWRLSARDSAARLGELVERVRNGGKVDLVAHSAGAIVALTYVELLGGANQVENLILVAPVQRGVADAFRVFVQPERIIRRELRREMVLSWPFVVELLPEEGRLFVDENGQPLDEDLWREETWRRLVGGVPPALASARRLRDELRDTPTPPGVRVTVIAGDCVPTARRILARRDGTFAFYASQLRENEAALAPLLFEPGDGTVPVSSARAGGEAMLFCDGHQGIASDPNVHRALVRILRE